MTVTGTRPPMKFQTSKALPLARLFAIASRSTVATPVSVRSPFIVMRGAVTPVGSDELASYVNQELSSDSLTVVRTVPVEARVPCCWMSAIFFAKLSACCRDTLAAWVTATIRMSMPVTDRPGEETRMVAFPAGIWQCSIAG